MKKKLSKTIVSLGPLFGLVLVSALFAILAPAEFHSYYNVKTIITQTVIIAIGALGMTFVIISGGIDLSVGSQIALCTVVIASVMNFFGAGSETMGLLPSVLAAFSGVLVCGLCGLLIGLIINGLSIVPFIVTLGMMQVIRGAAKWIAKEQTVFCSKNSLFGLMDVDPAPAWIQLSYGVWISLLLLILVSIILKYTVFGRHVFAIGSNEQTAKLCGINVPFKRTIIYILCGVFTGIAGIMQFSNLTVGDPTAGNGMELDIIAAVVIGGGSLSGGKGNALGTFVGALIMAVLRNGCNMLGAPNYLQEIIIGVIIIAAIAIDRLKNKALSV
jgi:ribose transport system permease protein